MLENDFAEKVTLEENRPGLTMGGLVRGAV